MHTLSLKLAVEVINCLLQGYSSQDKMHEMKKGHMLNNLGVIWKAIL